MDAPLGFPRDLSDEGLIAAYRAGFAKEGSDHPEVAAMAAEIERRRLDV